jgi:P27 family predicted phage terminase small subunit
LPKNEPEPTPVDPSTSAPTWLSPLAREEWDRLAPELVSLGLLTVLDVAPLAGFCECYSTWRTAKEQIDAAIASSPVGLSLAISHGLVKTAKESLAQMVRIAAEFGFTPSTRSRVTGVGKEDDSEDPFGDWARRRILKGGKP